MVFYWDMKREEEKWKDKKRREIRTEEKREKRGDMRCGSWRDNEIDGQILLVAFHISSPLRNCCARSVPLEVMKGGGEVKRNITRGWLAPSSLPFPSICYIAYSIFYIPFLWLLFTLLSTVEVTTKRNDKFLLSKWRLRSTVITPYSSNLPQDNPQKCWSVMTSTIRHANTKC